MMPPQLPAYAGRTGPFPPSMPNLFGPTQWLGRKSGERCPAAGEGRD